MSHRRLVLDNGIRVLLEEMPRRTTASTSVTVARGSRHEAPADAGITHFIEHMLFKGTSRRDLYAIARDMNLQGGNMNASTSHETLRVYTTVVAEDVRESLELMQDMLWHSTFPAQEVERERGVILEEIAEANDIPDDLCYETWLSELFAGTTLEHPILGTPESVGAFQREELLRAWDAIRHPGNVIVSIAGGVDLDAAEAIARDIFAHLPAGAAPPATAFDEAAPLRATLGGRSLLERDLEQVQFCLGVPTPGQRDDSRYVLAYLDMILGAGMGSRLFNEVRERRGLAYSIGSSTALFSQEGYFLISGSTSPDTIDDVLAVCREEALKLAAEGPTAEEMDTAQRQVLRGILMAMENPGYRAGRNVARELYDLDVNDDVVIERMKSITAAEVQDLARQLFDGVDMTQTLVGPLPSAAEAGAA
ncbi:MAG: pitrilysin family protein [Sumerlaeia bacterium]